jgi:hypothetical protein
MAGETRIKKWWVPRAKEFQHTFVKYFPHLEDFDAAANEWSWLHSHWTLNQISTVRRSQSVKELESIIRALRLLAKGSCWPWWGTIYGAQTAAEADSRNRVTQDLGYIANALEELNNINLPNDVGADFRLEAALALFRKGALENLSHLPNKGSTNWKAVFAVDALRAVWWRNTGREAPAKALNPASEFASYLRDGFGYLNVKASPVPAFRRWVGWCNATDRET